MQEERVRKWKEHFKNLLENYPEMPDKPIENFMNCQLNTKLGEFTAEELDGVLKWN